MPIIDFHVHPAHYQRLLTYFPELERAADKVIYGSDWPGLPTMKENLQAVRSLSLSEET